MLTGNLFYKESRGNYFGVLFCKKITREDKKMVGIYKIQNKQNGKIYIGQSNDIERRIKEHCYPSRYIQSQCPIDYAIHKYGKDSFTYEVVEECSIEELNDKETYWIAYYNSITSGYNCNYGGKQQSVGSFNGRAKLSEEDVVEIRQAYANHLRQKDVYKKFQNKISWTSFQSIWQGKVWKHIMPEVLTEENREYYIYQNSMGEKGNNAKLTDEEVSNFRKRFQYESAREMYPEVEDKVTYQTFQRILSGIGGAYSHIPVYKKAPKYIFSDKEVQLSRDYYVTHSAKQTYNHFDFAKNVPFTTFKSMLEGIKYTHLPWYSKKNKQWITPE